AAEYPDLIDTFRRAADGARSHPLPIDGATTNSGAVIRLDEVGFVHSLFLALYSTKAIPELPRAIKQVADGELKPPNVIAREELRSGSGLAEAMRLSVWCNEDVPFYTDAAANDAARGVDRRILRAHVGVSVSTTVHQNRLFCGSWVSGPRDDRSHEPVTSAVPTLILAGEYDPITPPVFAHMAA